MMFSSGLPETACGYGSTIEATANVRDGLRALLDRLGVKTLLDAPCGDFNWMASIDLTGIDYIGVDYSAENIATAQARAPHMDFRELDIVNDELPEADAILCRDFFQHLPVEMALKALGNMSGARWLIATSHDADKNGDIRMPGGFHRCNLEIAPFNLGAPVEAIEDGPGRILGVWDMRAC